MIPILTRPISYQELEKVQRDGVKMVYQGNIHHPRRGYNYYFTLVQGEKREDVKMHLSERELEEIARAPSTLKTMKKVVA